MPRLTAVTASATVAAAEHRHHRGIAAEQAAGQRPGGQRRSGTRITASTGLTAAQRRGGPPGAMPWPAAVRAATSLISSCSTGKNTPRPSRKTRDHSTDICRHAGRRQAVPGDGEVRVGAGAEEARPPRSRPPAERVQARRGTAGPATAFVVVVVTAMAWPTATARACHRGRRQAGRQVRHGRAQVTGEALVDLLAGEPEIGQRVPVRRARVPPARCPASSARMASAAGPLSVSPKCGVHRLDGAQRVRDEIVIVDVAEPGRVVPGPRRGELVEAAGPRLQLVPADHLAAERGGPAGRGLRREAAHRRDRGPRRRGASGSPARPGTPAAARPARTGGWGSSAPSGGRVRQADQLQVAPVPR